MKEQLVSDADLPQTDQSLHLVGAETLEEQANTKAHQTLGNLGVGESASVASNEGASELYDALDKEEYTRSLRRMRELGGVAISGLLNSETGERAKETVRRDWTTSLAEILENEAEFRGRFEISDVYNYPIVDGQISFNTANGPTSMLQMIRDGAAKSEAAAEQDPRMETQAKRDAADVHNAERLQEITENNGLNTRMIVSRDLGQAIEEDPDFWEQKGYRKGLAFLQLYYVENDEVTTGTFSVDSVPDAVFDKALEEQGVFAPPGDNDNGVRYGVERSFGGKDEAIAFAKSFRARCYELNGDNRKRQSVNNFIQEHEDKIDAAFESLCVPLASAVASGNNNEKVRQFAEGLISNPKHIKDEVISQLYKIDQKTEFDDDDGRLLHELSLYAVAEMLFNSAKNKEVHYVQPSMRVVTNTAAPPPAHVINQLAGFVHSGAKAARSHGSSCSGTTKISKADDPEDNLLPNLQAAFGGLSMNGEGSNKDENNEDGEDGLGPRVFKCTEGHTNVRPKGKLLEKCQVSSCKKGSVGC